MAFEASRDLSARPNHMPTPKSFFLLHKQLFYDEEKILKNVDKAFLQSRRQGPFSFQGQSIKGRFFDEWPFVNASKALLRGLEILV